jgi:hypothetical protein
MLFSFFTDLKLFTKIKTFAKMIKTTDKLKAQLIGFLKLLE